jgi:hypothetical protein
MKSDQADFIRISNFLTLGSGSLLRGPQLLLHHGLQVGKSAQVCYLSVDQDGRNPPDADPPAKIALLQASRSLPEVSFLTSSKNYATAFPMSPSTRKAYLKRVKRIKT